MKKTNDALRTQYLNLITELLAGADEEVLRVKSNEIAIPCIDGEGEDQYIVFTVKVPVGSRDGDAYDAYERAQEYEMKCRDKEEKAKKAAEEKARKIARDQKMREQKRAAKEAHEKERD